MPFQRPGPLKRGKTVGVMNRNRFLGAGAGAALSFGSVALASASEVVPGGRQFVEPHSAFDERAFDAELGRPADIRQLWENLSFKPSVFNGVKNALNGLHFGFAYPASAVAIALANHGPSSAYNFTDHIWAKYRIGEFFGLKDASGTLIAHNVFLARKNPADGPRDPNDLSSPYQDTSIEALQSRGVVFLACHTAIEETSRALVKAGHAAAGMSGSDVAADILTHLIPGAVVVPSMVATIAVLQARLRYTYITQS
jgi:intracellular sulfur oxidation DsrE/DsrF family protein